MKKFAATFALLLPAMSAFAQYYDSEYGYSRSSGMTGFEIFTLFVMIVSIIVSIAVLVRWWKMTSQIADIHKKLTQLDSESPAYLIAVGEKEKAEKAALEFMVRKLSEIYYGYVFNREAEMDSLIKINLPTFERLGFSLPDHVTSGKKFIDYMNGLTGKKVPYEGFQVTTAKTVSTTW
ncbi:MAG TPA: hypothetical protein DC009_06535 [Porphyromonadaceae bacterium]|nr:hypothetical protein [Porphyromonadaceae bacterium]